MLTLNGHNFTDGIWSGKQNRLRILNAYIRINTYSPVAICRIFPKAKRQNRLRYNAKLQREEWRRAEKNALRFL